MKKRQIKELPSWVWYRIGINPDDPADWPLMSNLHEEMLTRYLDGEFDKEKANEI